MPNKGWILVGGLLDDAARRALEEHAVKLIVSCFQDLCTDRGGVIHRGAFQIEFNYKARKFREKHWEALKVLIKPTFAQGHGLYVHCAAGCHRAPVAAAFMRSFLQGATFDSISHIQKLY